MIRQAVTCPRAAHKAQTYRGLRSFQLAAAVPSAGTPNTPNSVVFCAGAIGHSRPRARFYAARIPLIEGLNFVAEITSAASKAKAAKQSASPFSMPNFDIPTFDLPKMEIPEVFRQMTEEGVAHA